MHDNSVCGNRRPTTGFIACCPPYSMPWQSWGCGQSARHTASLRAPWRGKAPPTWPLTAPSAAVSVPLTPPYKRNIILYFPVKRVVFMPPRACHSVPLFPSAVCGGQERLSASAQWGRAFCGVAQAAPASLYNAPRPGAVGACPTSASGPDPRSPWAEQAGSPRSTSRWPRPPVPVRAAADDFLEQRRIDAPHPTSAWPSRAALPPASGRDRTPAGGHPSTAARCSRGVARQSADHGSARC